MCLSKQMDVNEDFRSYGGNDYMNGKINFYHLVILEIRVRTLA